MPIALSTAFDAGLLRAAARRSRDAGQTRRLLALAAVYDGATRTEAAAIGGVTLQIVRDWVVRAERAWPGWPGRRQGSWSPGAAGGPAPRGAGRGGRGRADPGGAWGRALADHRPVPMDARRVCAQRVQADTGPRAASTWLSHAVGTPHQRSTASRQAASCTLAVVTSTLRISTAFCRWRHGLFVHKSHDIQLRNPAAVLHSRQAFHRNEVYVDGLNRTLVKDTCYKHIYINNSLKKKVK